ncbi:MAG: beta-lactamase induction protein [Xanthomonadaceae bacterium]|nr:beta-lactamase induction protein [Xanthomonadaceae bacterium]MDE2178240.1 beta-lactamase induction protein [Xanthomonadaceae bacterium]MDE2246658.1 beta-lactamase induction protein [Xanthomonadaceae bacterium]
MALKLLAILIALGLIAALPQLARYRRFGLLRGWFAALAGSAAGLALALALPAAIAAALAWWLHGVLLGVFGLAFAVAVLVLGFGPRELEADIDAVLKAPDAERRSAAGQALNPEERGEPLAWNAAALVGATAIAALRRRFSVLFWFFVLGPAGAVLYRMARLAAGSDGAAAGLDAAARARAARVADILDWLPAHLMVLAMALAADFDAVLRAWRAWHATPGRTALDPAFLESIAQAGVNADVEAGDGYAEDTADVLGELTDLSHLLGRVLVVWLALAALVVLGGWFA